MVPRNLLLLLSDDLKKNGEVAASLGERGYSVFRVGSQDEAVRKMKTKSVDLLICDTSFVKDGQKAFSEFLAANGERFLPVILVAADMGDDEKGLFKTLPGVRAMVSRPLDINQLEKLVAGNLPDDAPIPGLEPDDDSEKPLYDKKDNISIDIGVFLRRGASEPTKVTLVEYEEKSVLVEVGSFEAAKGDEIEVSIQSAGPTGNAQMQFKGTVLSVEDVEDGGGRLISIDSTAVAAEFSKKIMGQVTRRQSELLKFIRDTQE